MTALSGQPFPDLHGWQDLAALLVFGWSPEEGVRCGIKLAGNDAKISAVLLVGDDRVIAQGLPTLDGSRDLQGTFQTGSDYLPTTVRWRDDGTLLLQSAQWNAGQDYRLLHITGEVPR